MSQQRLGPYRLVHQVGGGGMGVVHLGLDGEGRAVAVKVLRPHLANDPAARARLAREADTLRLVRSPRVAEVLDTDPGADPPYIVTEYVPAPPLDEHVTDVGPLTGRALVRLGLGLGEALSAIHRAGVVHRDLKPGNVLIDDGEPVVIDFGIAQITDDVRLTSTGLVMGTPGYLSPEVIDGAPVSVVGDWWGWAATMVFAATGRAPFGNGPLDAVLARVHRGTPDLVGVAEPFASLLTAALSPDPADRPTPRALREALQATAGSSGAPADGQFRHSGSRNGSSGHAVGHAAGHVDGLTVDLRRAPEGATRPLRGAATTPVAAATTTPVRATTTPLPAMTTPVQGTTTPLRGGPHSWSGAAGPHPTAVPRAPDSVPLSAPTFTPSSWPSVPAAAKEPAGTAPRTEVLVALLAALVALAAVAPVWAAIVLVAGSVLARTVDRASDALLRRRHAHGVRSSDAALTALAVPGHVLAAAAVTVPALLLPLLMGVSAAFLAGWAVEPQGVPAPGVPASLAVGALSAALTAWLGPGAGSLRRGPRQVARAVSPSRRAATVTVAVLALVALAAAIVVLQGDGQPDWSPLSGPPLGIGAAAA